MRLVDLALDQSVRLINLNSESWPGLMILDICSHPEFSPGSGQVAFETKIGGPTAAMRWVLVFSRG